MKAKKISEKTTNRGEFNRAYKYYLEHVGEIRCSWCKYHKNENDKSNSYGGFDDIKYPNWKLVSKRKKQWMKKPMKIIVDKFRRDNSEYTTIIF